MEKIGGKPFVCWSAMYGACTFLPKRKVQKEKREEMAVVGSSN